MSYYYSGFVIGDKVCFRANRLTYIGIVSKINAKSLTIHPDPTSPENFHGCKYWTVPPEEVSKVNSNTLAVGESLRRNVVPFTRGERVEFTHQGRSEYGRVLKINAKTITVQLEDASSRGFRTNKVRISPKYLTRMEVEEDEHITGRKRTHEQMQ